MRLQKRYILAGQSHAMALGLDTGTDISLNPTEFFDGRLLGLTGPSLRNPRYWDALVEQAAGADIFLAWGGNQHLAHFFLQPGVGFDFYLKSHPDVAVSNLPLVPEAQVRALLDIPNGGLRSLIDRLKQQG